jgi:hypothetical protein
LEWASELASEREWGLELGLVQPLASRLAKGWGTLTAKGWPARAGMLWLLVSSVFRRPPRRSPAPTTRQPQRTRLPWRPWTTPVDLSTEGTAPTERQTPASRSSTTWSGTTVWPRRFPQPAVFEGSVVVVVVVGWRPSARTLRHCLSPQTPQGSPTDCEGGDSSGSQGRTWRRAGCALQATPRPLDRRSLGNNWARDQVAVRGSSNVAPGISRPPRQREKTHARAVPPPLCVQPCIGPHGKPSVVEYPWHAGA